MTSISIKQEPVAWANFDTPSGIFARYKTGAENFNCTVELYTQPSNDDKDKQIAKLRELLSDAVDDVELSCGVLTMMSEINPKHTSSNSVKLKLYNDIKEALGHKE